MTNDTKPEPIGEVIIGEDPTGLSKDKWTVVRWREGAPPIKVGTKLYDEAALTQARAVPRQPLDKDQIDFILGDSFLAANGSVYSTRVYDFVRAIEDAHGIADAPSPADTTDPNH